jgi:hypothetical protein
MKNFNEFIKEGLRDAMTPKPDEEIFNKLNSLDLVEDKVRFINKNRIPKKFYENDKEVIEYLDNRKKMMKLELKEKLEEEGLSPDSLILLYEIGVGTPPEIFKLDKIFKDTKLEIDKKLNNVLSSKPFLYFGDNDDFYLGDKYIDKEKLYSDIKERFKSELEGIHADLYDCFIGLGVDLFDMKYCNLDVLNELIEKE